MTLSRQIVLDEHENMLLAEASASKRRVTIRGRGHSADGQALGDDVVMTTEGLSRILSVDPARQAVTVEAGVRFHDLVEALGPHELYPPVLTGWLPATVGGVLATGGFSKGSHRAGLVIDHVDSLVVAEAFVGKSIVMKRFHARGRGRASRVEKPFSHLTIVVREVEAKGEAA